MRSSDRDRPDHQRLALAVETARIIQEEGLLDFRSAKAKAAARLGLGRKAHLPCNSEIEAALAERNRIFHGESLPELLTTLRQAAFELMRDLSSYQPRLVGDVLSGNATVHTSVDLHIPPKQSVQAWTHWGWLTEASPGVIGSDTTKSSSFRAIASACMAATSPARYSRFACVAMRH